MKRTVWIPIVVAIIALVALVAMFGGGNTAGPAPGLSPTETATPAGS